MTARIFAIGDIHGHAEELRKLLLLITKEANYNPDVDHLVLLGDLVDVGPDSREVVEWCMLQKELFPNTFHPLKGNHDDMFVDSSKYNCKKYAGGIWYTQGGEQTLLSYSVGETEEEVEVDIPKEHVNFLETLPLYWWPEDSDYFFVHAGIPPQPLSELDPDDPKTQFDLLWIREPFYTSRMNFGRKIIFAHTPFLKHTAPGVASFEPFVQDNMIGINTMPRNEGKLTCLELPKEEFYYVPKD